MSCLSVGPSEHSLWRAAPAARSSPSPPRASSLASARHLRPPTDLRRSTCWSKTRQARALRPRASVTHLRPRPRSRRASCAICVSCCAIARRSPGCARRSSAASTRSSAQHGITHEHSDLLGKGGRAFLVALELRDAPRRRLDSLIALIEDFDREIEHTTGEIEQRAKADDRVDVLTQIRGVGRYTALLIIAEVGDISRFPSARHLCSWAGLAPTVRSSDGKARLGHITGQGSPALRWALVEAAQHSARGGGPLRQAYERITKRRGKSVAKVAVARKILTLCFYGLRDGEIRCLAPRARARTNRTLAVAP